MLESQPPIRFSEQLLGAEAQRDNIIFYIFCKVEKMANKGVSELAWREWDH